MLAASLLVVASAAAIALYALPAATDAPSSGGDIGRAALAFDPQLTADDLSPSITQQRPAPPSITVPSRLTDPTLSDTPAVSPDMPVNEMLDLLGERARRGDAVAACELARAMFECRMQPMISRMPATPAPPEGAGRKQVDRFIEQEARREEWRSRLDQRCGGVTRTDLSEGIAFTARAALGGHVPSLLDFLNAPMMAPAEFIRDPQLGHVYRTQGWPLLQRALAERDYRVASTLFRQLAYMPIGPLSAIVPDRYQDPEVARAMFQLLGGQLPPSAQPAAASDEAVATAEQWADELFGGELPEGTTSSTPGMMPMPGDAGARCRDADAWLDATAH